MCANVRGDPLNCGGCSLRCEPWQVCVERLCEDACPANLALCVGQCVDMANDPRHCGECGLACSPPGRCREGACQQ
jgi:hypothetical protein